MRRIKNGSAEVIHLYEGKAPGSEDWTQREVKFSHQMMAGLMVRNVVDPTLTLYRPVRPNGTAVIVCPGGAFYMLSWQSEGTEVAEWLAARGITAFVLKYRLVDTGPTMEDFEKSMKRMMELIDSHIEANKDAIEGNLGFTEDMKKVRALAIDDGIRAVRYVRQHASEYSINPNHIGMIGFSAGSAVGMGVALKCDLDSRPDFIGHIYGMDAGKEKIPANAPPLFVLSAADDMIAATNPDLFRQWRAAGNSAELHIYSKGGHGFGMRQQKIPVDSWIERFYDWLKVSGF